jgi:hypothetical protein
MSHDPIEAAFKSLHQGNLLAAEKAKLQNVTYAGNELARVMEDILGSDQITCAISRAVMTSTVAKWKQVKTSE